MEKNDWIISFKYYSDETEYWQESLHTKFFYNSNFEEIEKYLFEQFEHYFIIYVYKN